MALSASDHMQALTMVQAARAVAYERFPYLSTALSQMTIVPKPGLGTVASDARWRFYFDPERVIGMDDSSQGQSIDQVVSDWIHELEHLLRNHMQRWSEISQPDQLHVYFNIAGDVLINHNLHTLDLPILDSDVTFQRLPMQVAVDPTMTTEEIYFRLIQFSKLRSESCSVHGNREDGSDDGSESSGESGSSGKLLTGECNCENESLSGNSDTSQEGGVFGGSFVKRDCGSSSGGNRRSWEDDIDDDPNDGSVSSGRGDLIRAAVAQDIVRQARAGVRGNVPLGLVVWAEGFLNPVIDWRRELRSVISRELGLLAGRKDYSYMRSSRRKSPGVILAGMVNAQPPKVTVVIDTSGSMSIGNRLNQALVEISGLVRAVSGGARPLQVIACDAAASTPRAVRSIDHIELTGGGGTDMRIGIQAAACMKPRPDIIITITDGETPWPLEASVHAPKATYLAVVLDENDHRVPSFMKKIVIPARMPSQN